MGAKWTQGLSSETAATSNIERNLLDEQLMERMIRTVPGVMRHPQGLILDAMLPTRTNVAFDTNLSPESTRGSLHADIELLDFAADESNFGMGFGYPPRGVVRAYFAQTAGREAKWWIREIPDYSQSEQAKTIVTQGVPTPGNPRFDLQVEWNGETMTIFVDGQQVASAPSMNRNYKTGTLSVHKSKCLIRQWMWSPVGVRSTGHLDGTYFCPASHWPASDAGDKVTIWNATPLPEKP